MKPLYVRCADCLHVWPVVYLPIHVDRLVEICLHARCPLCGGAEANIARQKDGALLDDDDRRINPA